MTRNSLLLALSLVTLGFMVSGCEDPAANVKSAKVKDVPANTKTVEASKYKDTVSLNLSEANGAIGFTGSKVTGKHDGGFKKFSGTVKVNDFKPEESSFEVTIDMDSTFSDSEKLTGHLKGSDFFDVKAHPTSTFKSTNIKKSGDKYEVTGEFKLHGVTKSISFPATIVANKDLLELKSEFSINRKDFGIVYKGRADDLIRDGVVIRLAFTVKDLMSK